MGLGACPARTRKQSFSRTSEAYRLVAQMQFNYQCSLVMNPRQFSITATVLNFACLCAPKRSQGSRGRSPSRAVLNLAVIGALQLAGGLACFAQPDPNWIDHDRNRPQPPLVTPATASTQERPGKAPSDAVVLFDGKDISQWCSMDGSPTKWITRDGYMECVRGSGYVRTLQNFGDCQLHVEWTAPVPPRGEGQGRGNSGVFFGLDRYELQVLDSYDNKTYADGAAGAVYGQYPPLVNVSLPPGQWQTYDIVYTAPRFDAEGKLLSPA